MEEMRKAYQMLVGKAEGKKLLCRSGHRSGIILKHHEKQRVTMWIGFNWLRISSSGELL
jgi:hypothetical protein